MSEEPKQHPEGDPQGGGREESGGPGEVAGKSPAEPSGESSGKDRRREFAGGRRARSSRPQQTIEQAINPQSSYWPFALAIALCITLIGVIIHPVVFGVGLALVAAAIVGWGLEHH